MASSTYARPQTIVKVRKHKIFDLQFRARLTEETSEVELALI